jgi:hypothetical protein
MFEPFCVCEYSNDSVIIIPSQWSAWLIQQPPWGSTSAAYRIPPRKRNKHSTSIVVTTENACHSSVPHTTATTPIGLIPGLLCQEFHACHTSVPHTTNKQTNKNNQPTVDLISGTTTGCRIKSHPGCSGHVWNIVYTDLTMRDVGQPIFLDEFYSAPPVRRS